MRLVDIREAQTHLSRLRLGILAGRFTISADFDAPLADEARDTFENRD